MRKKILLMLFILLCPVLALAKDTCNNNDITIKSITKNSSTGYTEEIQEPSIDNNKINLNLEMYNIDESITYDITIKNDSEEVYYFTKDSLNMNTDYLEYEFLNDSEIIKSNEEKTIQLKITYKNKIPEDSYNENKQVTIALADEPLTNPDTKVQYILIILIMIIISIFFFTVKKKSLKLLSLFLIPLIPITTKALCTINLEINMDITINEKEAIFLPGKEVNVKMKQLAGDDTTTNNEKTENTSITAILYSNTEPNESNKQAANIVSKSDSSYPIYMWYESGTIYWWSEDKNPSLNQDSSYMFHRLSNLNNLDGIKRFNVKNVINMSSMFYKDASIFSIEALRNWNTSNVVNMSWIFCFCYNLSSIDALRNWDVSKVEDLTSFLMEDSNITTLEPLKNWNTTNVTTLFQAFWGIGVNNLSGLENWNTSNLQNISSLFTRCQSLLSLEALKNWDTSNVTTMAQMFLYTDLTNLHGLENWNVSKVITFQNTFSNNTNLVDASAINNWDIQPTASFQNMFYKAPSHPEFTKVQGTWSNNGTFIPSQ